MRANRKFVWDDDAVSPVIAVILMVAITVVLAATVFVLVSDIGSQGQKQAPNVNMNQDETGDALSVTSVGTGANWNRVQFRMPSTAGQTGVTGWGARFDPDGTTNDAGLSPQPGTYLTVTNADIPMKPGDKLCFWASPGPASNVKIELQDSVAASAIGSGYTFQTLLTATKTSC